MTSSAPCNGSRRAFSQSGKKDKVFQPPDLRQITILKQTGWHRIQDEMNGVDKEKERLREAAKRREALHLQSKEIVKLWPDTIAGQRQKKLEAKKLREEMEEEKRKEMAAEEAKYKEEEQKEALAKARTQLYYQNDRVKGLNRALLHTEVLKEREAQTELKQRMKSATEGMDKKFLEIMTTRNSEALRKEQEKAVQKKLERQTVAEDLKNQIKANEFAREQQKLEIKRDAEEIQQLQERHQREQRMESERQANQKRSLMNAHLVSQKRPDCTFFASRLYGLFICTFCVPQDHLNSRALRKEQEAQKQKAEEEQMKLFLSAKEQMTKLRKQREKELFSEVQQRRERILNKLTATQQEQATNEEQRIAKALAEWDARQAQLQLEEERKKSEMLKSIAAHRELLRKEKEHLDKIAEQETRDALQAKREADKIYAKKQQLKAEKMREEQRKLHDFNVAQMAERSARLQQMKDEERDFEATSAKLSAEEELKFQQYSQHIIKAAAEARRNLIPLYKATREGVGGGHGPVFSGVRPSYLVQDSTGAQMPRYVSITTESIRKLNEAGDIHEAKKRLGFTW
ncbi:cilia- and flagella- associated protein 210 isoform X1 [Poeciliopsis prolifica]|uniref:cilia- and flagella- associated protein 210 isoform X1 n=1 Tax=Poeciliopsis prolifica TaxID=188132 RepID=UPI002413783B|nr:cilia- and flagella- associated protein 210 isoform X1 [Poeciliopsis prolifica]